MPGFYLFLLSVLFLTNTCQSGNATSNAAQKDKERNYRLTISFTSICCGINTDAKKRLDESVSGYEKSKHVSLEKNVVHYGKEGETDYCFKLSELSKKEQKKFVSEIKKVLDGAERVQVSENVPCINDGKPIK